MRAPGWIPLRVLESTAPAGKPGVGKVQGMKTESVKGSSEGTIRNTPLAQALAAHRKSASFMEGDYGIGYVTIKKAHTILLGQTKYYYAVDDPNNPGKVIIKESLVPEKGKNRRSLFASADCQWRQAWSILGVPRFKRKRSEDK